MVLCDKALLDDVTSRVCAAAKELLDGKLRQADVFDIFYVTIDF
jgi:hypothetical protein